MLHETNPYAAPTANTEEWDASWHLNRAQKYYRRMGGGMLIYCAANLIISGILQFAESTLGIADVVAGLIFAAPLAWLFLALVRLGRVVPQEFPLYYKKARWSGIIAGGLFFPLLSVPAFIALRSLTKYQDLSNKGQTATSKTARDSQ